MKWRLHLVALVYLKSPRPMAKITELKAPDIVREQTENLRKVLEKGQRLREEHLGIYKKEVEELTSQLHTIRAVVSQMTYQYDSELEDMDHVKEHRTKVPIFITAWCPT